MYELTPSPLPSLHTPDDNIDDFYKKFDMENLVRFEPDHPEGPQIGFVYNELDRDVRSVILEHRLYYHKMFTGADGEPVPLSLVGQNQRLVYTPKEWVAFCLSVAIGEYDFPEEVAEISIRDSKLKQGHYFIFDYELFGNWIAGVKAGKYMLPAEQDAVLSSWVRLEYRLWKFGQAGRTKETGVTVL